MESKLDQVEIRLDNMENRLDKVEIRLDNMENRLDKVEGRLDKIEETLDEVKEDGLITREATNSICGWIEFYFGKEKPFPLDIDEIEEQEQILKMVD